jgi:YidC/Oxa1 family membrane protein insertase
MAGGFGLAIILLTVIVKLAMWPLSVSQQKSMKKMQALTPKIKDIQVKYKNNPQVMQMKMMEFYKENKFNPMGGVVCLC